MRALAQLQPGQWVFTGAERASPPLRACIVNPADMIQLESRPGQCSRFVIADGPRETVVHYTCPGSGHGRTVIRVETPQLVQLQSQGILGAEPFDWRREGRRVGACPR